jgi:hypothetical protein
VLTDPWQLDRDRAIRRDGNLERPRSAQGVMG